MSHSRVDLDTSFEQSRSFVSRAGKGTPDDDITVLYNREDIEILLPTPGVFSDPALYRQEGSTGGTFNQFNEVDDSLTAFSVDFSKNLYPEAYGFGYKLGIGGQRIDREFDREVYRYRVSDADQLAYTLAVNNPSLGEVSSIDNIFIDRQAYWDFVIANNVNTGTSDGDSFKPDIFNFEADYELLEDVYSGYGMASYGGDNFRIIGGLRVEHTQLENDGFLADEMIGGSTNVTPDSDTNEYTNVLPSLHFIFSPGTELNMRLSYSKTIARPDFQDFAQRSSTEVVEEDGQTRLEIFEGDTDLEARESDNIDFGGEYYFRGYDGFVSAALFYKSISNEHYRQVSRLVNAMGDEQEISRARDNSRASVSGLELNFIMNSLDFLPSPYNRFGVHANYTFTDGEWEIPGDNGTSRIIDGLRSQPDQLARLKLRYRHGNFGVDLSAAYRGEYFTGRFGETQANDIYVEDLTRLTLSSFYRIGDRFSVHMDVRDLNKPKYLEVTGIHRNLVRRVIESDPSYWFGIKYQL